MFAKIVNIHWSFLSDGSYDITVDLVSIGDIVESFKINALTSGKLIEPSGDQQNVGQKTDTAVIDLYANKNDIGQYFYSLKNTPALITRGINNSDNAVIRNTSNNSINFFNFNFNYQRFFF